MTTTDQLDHIGTQLIALEEILHERGLPHLARAVGLIILDLALTYNLIGIELLETRVELLESRQRPGHNQPATR